MNAPTKPLGAYCRVSSQGDRDELRSPDQQRKAIQRYADANGVAVDFSAPPDIDSSGSKLSRAILNGIIERVRAGELGGVIVMRLDRLSRLSPRDRVELFEDIEGAGGIVLSASEQLDPSTPEGRFAREVFLGIARMQWEKYRDGFEESKEGAIREGIPVVTRAAVGLRPISEEDRRLELDPLAAPAVREVFERRAAGAGPTELAALLEREGVRTSQGSGTWSKQAVYGMLKNPIYKGVLQWGGRFVNETGVPPIVDLATWTAAQHPNGSSLPPVGEKSDWLLAGLLRCAACRYSLQGTTTSRGKRIYRCTRRHAGGLCPAPATIAAEKVEQAVIGAFWSLTADLEAEGGREAHADLSGLEDALERAQERVEQLLPAAMQDQLGDRYGEVFSERQEDVRRAAEALGHARAEQAASESAEAVSVERLSNAWERMSTRDRRELLGLRFDCIALSRDPVAIVAYPAGTGPTDLPRRGYKVAPVLGPFPDPPASARLLAL